MLKRLLFVGGFTGLAHLLNLLSLKVLASKVSVSQVSLLGEIDSLIVILISMIFFGLQLSATREIALQENWRKIYYETQSARFMLSLFFIAFAISGFWYTKNFIFIIAPTIALNGDYGLYGRGKPKTGAVISFIRVLISAITLLFFSFYYTEWLIPAYAISLFVAYLVAGLLVSKYLEVRYFVKPILENLKLYIKNLLIGISSIFYTIIGVGIVSIASHFYNDESIATAYLFLKVYIIFRGVKQIIVQSFFKDLSGNESIGNQVDHIAMIAGWVYFMSFAVFPDIMAKIFFSSAYSGETLTLLVLGFAAFYSSFSTTAGAQLLLKNKDRVYSRNIIISGIVTIVAIIIFNYTIGDKPFSIALGVLAGEISLTTLDGITLSQKKYWIIRIKSIIPFILVGGLIFILEPYINSIILYAIMLITMGIMSLVSVNHKKIGNFRNEK